MRVGMSCFEKMHVIRAPGQSLQKKPDADDEHQQPAAEHEESVDALLRPTRKHVMQQQGYDDRRARVCQRGDDAKKNGVPRRPTFPDEISGDSGFAMPRHQ